MSHRPRLSSPIPAKRGLIPNIAPDDQEAKHESFATYLETTLGVDVELLVTYDYAGVVAARSRC